MPCMHICPGWQRPMGGRTPGMHGEGGRKVNATVLDLYQVDHEIDTPEKLDTFPLCPSPS